MGAKFGPGGNSVEFAAAKLKKSSDIPKWVHDYGLDAYEYEAGRGVSGSMESFMRLGEEARKYGISLSLHAPYYISLSGVEKETRLKSVDYIVKSLEAAYAMGASIIVVHTGSAGKISREQAVALASDTLEHVIDVVQYTPFKDISIGLETMGKKNQLGTLSEVISLCKIDKIFRPVVDFGHINAFTLGEAFKNRDDYKRIFSDIAEGLGDEYANTLHCHFSKIQYTDGGEKKHLDLDDTVYGPPFEPLMEAIHELKLSPTIISESCDYMDRDALRMKNYYNSLGEI
ncbi:MAG: endonuclease IV [Ruminococcaceae bacterium]|nr:endonuclease IV [Oscillospiraceae bacterium]